MEKRGFTLIEVLIAMAILVVVVASTLAIFHTSASSWQKGEIRAQRYQAARFILERMSREITSIIPTSLAGPYCLGMANKFYFVCSLAVSPTTNLIEVGYYLDEDNQALMRSFQSSPDYNFSTFEKEEDLSENVAALNFQYSPGINIWQESWDSRLGSAQSGILPKAVKISFTIQDEKGAKSESFSTVVTLPAAQ